MSDGQNAKLDAERAQTHEPTVPRQGPETRATALDLPAADLSQPMRAHLAKCDEKLGFVPNVLAAYAHDDAKLAAFSGFYNNLMLAPSGLSKLEREMIAVVVSAANRCFYCVTAHGAAVRQLSGDPALGDTLGVNWRAARLDARRRAMLDFAERVASSSSTIAEADRQALREAGFSDVDIWDIAAVAAFFSMSNRLASATDMRPNAAYHGAYRDGPSR